MLIVFVKLINFIWKMSLKSKLVNIFVILTTIPLSVVRNCFIFSGIIHHEERPLIHYPNSGTAESEHQPDTADGRTVYKDIRMSR